MVNKTNSIAIDRSKYKTKEEFYNVVGEIIGALMDLDQIVVAGYDDVEIYIIEFDSADKQLGCRYPYWLLPNEEECVEYEE